MKKKLMFSVGVVAFISAAGLAYAAYAYQGDPAQKGPNFSSERHEQMQKAFKNNDYNAWKGLMNGRGRVTNAINEQNFARFAEMHQLMLEKKFGEADKIREELGISQGNKGWRNGNRNCPRMGDI